MKRLAALTAIILFATTALADQAVIGRASVVDGDTIDIRGERIRFNGIDAPESWQRCTDGQVRAYRCGSAAAKALDAFLAQSRPTRCEFIERDRYGRFVGDCFRQDGENVSKWLVTNGHALDWPRYSKGAYASTQKAAQRRRLGMWQGSFVLPCVARAERMKRKTSC